MKQTLKQITPELRATQSPAALMDYIAQGECGNWVIFYYQELSAENKQIFVKGMNEVLPYVKNREAFISFIKFSMKKDLCKSIAFDSLIEDTFCPTGVAILSDEGYRILKEKYRTEYDAVMEEWRAEMEQAAQER